jgi:4-hydroxythreonine-4-phosphate dehydrogenase
MGDLAGVGPEVIVGAWPDARIHERVRPIVLGHPEIVRRAGSLLRRDVKILEIASAEPLSEVSTGPDTIPCLRVGSDDVLDVPAGRVDARAGEAAYLAVRLATQLALDRVIDGIVTAPINKLALHAAGHYYPGHTELLAEMCGVRDFAMMLYLPPGTAVKSSHGLGVAHVTLHQSLRSVFADLSPEAIVAKCRLADGVMRRLGARRPRLAVCALNPHAGEERLFGDEESTIIEPAVADARRAGLDVTGPLPTDTLMVAARDGAFDAVVAMYHDQGHIALKLLGMHSAVNITLGLPIVRTSVAHGTAFDRAWQGMAEHEGMVAALVTAAKLANVA